jgi:ABC-2 type transport system permease protein
MTTTTTPILHTTGGIPTPADRVRWFVADTVVLTGRALRHQFRHVDGLITGAVLPVMLLLVFVYVLGGAIAGRAEYLRYVVPGVIVLAAGFGASQVAIAVTQDLTTGTIDRLRSMATSTGALLSGHVAANVVRNLGSTLLVVALAVVIGFRSDAGVLAWVGAAAVAVLFMVTIATVSVVIGVLARSPDGASGFTFFVLFLPYISSGFVEPETLPTILRGFAEHQPMTPVIETMRGLLLGTEVGADGWLAAAWCVGIIAVSIPLAAWSFRARTS